MKVAQILYMFSKASCELSGDRDKITAIFQTQLWNAFLKWKLVKFDSDFIKFVRKIQIDTIPALVQIMVWRRPRG